MKSLAKKVLKPLLNNSIYSHIHQLFFKLEHLYTTLHRTVQKPVRKKACILLYHKIAYPEYDKAALCVHPEHFRDHMECIKRNFEVISLLDLRQRILDKRLTGKEIVVTFDDGYKDNITYALPILEELDIPATIFVIAGSIGRKSDFTWDEEVPSEKRSYFMTREELHNISAHKLITIGAHTITHPRLYDLGEEDLIYEIEGSKKILEDITSTPIKAFAYPFGERYDFHIKATAVVKDNFMVACANIPLFVTHCSDIYALPRFVVRDLDKKSFSRFLSKIY